MPGKRKPTQSPPKASTKTAKEAKAGSASTPDGMALPSASNPQVQKHLIRVHEALQTIKSHPIFANVESLVPLTINEGGSQAPFSQTQMKTVLTQQESLPAEQRTGYKCSINGFWMNHLWLVNHRVSLVQQQLEHLAKSYPHDKPPAALRQELVIAVDSPSFDVQKHLGSLERLSPEEFVHVALFQLAKAITEGCEDSVLRRWLNMWLTVPVSFEVHAQGFASDVARAEPP